MSTQKVALKLQNSSIAPSNLHFVGKVGIAIEDLGQLCSIRCSNGMKKEIYRKDTATHTHSKLQFGQSIMKPSSLFQSL